MSGILTRPNTYQMEGREEKTVENKASKMTFLTGQQAGKCNANHEALPEESSKVAAEPQHEATTDWHCVDFNLAKITFSYIKHANC